MVSKLGKLQKCNIISLKTITLSFTYMRAWTCVQFTTNENVQCEK